MQNREWFVKGLVSGSKSISAGKRWNPDDILDIYDLKGTRTGLIEGWQRARLGSLSPTRTVKSVRPPYKWTEEGWTVTSARRLVRVFKIVGGISFVYALIVSSDAQAQELEDVIREARKIQKLAGTAKVAATYVWLKADVQKYLTHFDPDGRVVAIATHVAAVKVCRDFIDQWEQESHK